MATVEIHHIPVLGDHYIWRVRESGSGDRAVVDPAWPDRCKASSRSSAGEHKSDEINTANLKTYGR